MNWSHNIKLYQNSDITYFELLPGPEFVRPRKSAVSPQSDSNRNWRPEPDADRDSRPKPNPAKPGCVLYLGIRCMRKVSAWGTGCTSSPYWYYADITTPANHISNLIFICSQVGTALNRRTEIWEPVSTHHIEPLNGAFLAEFRYNTKFTWSSVRSSRRKKCDHVLNVHEYKFAINRGCNTLLS